MTEMFIFHDGLGRDIECFVSHPDIENDDEEGLGWEGVPLDVESDDEEELGTVGNGNEEEVQNIRWEGGQCGHDDIDKYASDDDTDSDGACSGLKDSSSSDAVDGELDEENDCSDDNCSVVSSSDEEEGLTESMDLLFPGVEHRFCMRHYYSNFQKVHKGKELKDLMWGAASVYTLPEYQAKIRELRAVSLEAHNWLINEPPKNWASSGSFYKCRGWGEQYLTGKRVAIGVPNGAGKGVARGRGLSRGRGVAIGVPTGAGKGVARGRGLSRGRGVAIGVPTGGGREMARGVTTERIGTRSWASQRGVTLGTGVGRGVAARGGVSRGKQVVVARGDWSRGKGVAVQTGGHRAVDIGAARNHKTGASGVARAVQIGAQPSFPTLVRNGKKVTFQSAVGGGYQPDWKIARIGDGVFSSQVYIGTSKGSTQ
ncbi:hypothetical protein RHSIM_Rhsim03G0113700 [Rhododendron simsii]|uniref:Uncharacterized protein n=1 Tax=Rhododendron simsii TaxID=118357 RepID=A0A834H6J2_RHOSS|nr:hypothetical protein RHSIM_Rhsim03G0113700 [Rhododendron simsii]